MNRPVLRALRPPGIRHAHTTGLIALAPTVVAGMTGDWTVRGRH